MRIRGKILVLPVLLISYAQTVKRVQTNLFFSNSAYTQTTVIECAVIIFAQ